MSDTHSNELGSKVLERVRRVRRVRETVEKYYVGAFTAAREHELVGPY
jgi:hypothetical protein